MTNMTLSMPDDVSKKMKRFSEIRWTEVARKAIVEKIEMMEKAEELAKKSKLSEKDARELSETIKEEASKRLMR